MWVVRPDRGTSQRKMLKVRIRECRVIAKTIDFLDGKIPNGRGRLL
jgi:hypothetical protein